MLGQQRLTAKLSLTQVSTLASFAPSSSTIPSVWRPHVPLSEETIIALRDAGLTELLHLLRADGNTTYAPAVPFVESLKSRGSPSGGVTANYLLGLQEMHLEFFVVVSWEFQGILIVSA